MSIGTPIEIFISRAVARAQRTGLYATRAAIDASSRVGTQQRGSLVGGAKGNSGHSQEV